jgi:hypothetical protein
MRTKIGMIAALILIGIAACEKDDELLTQSLEGTYIGTLKHSDNLKSSHLNGSATMDVILIDSSAIQVHCYGGEFDSTFMLNYFGHNDSVLVCLNGDDFEKMYGHRYGNKHGMGGGMMGNHQNEDTDWGHHMYDEHNEDDEHFGGFNMMNHTFDYRFNMHEGDSTYYLHFHGTKQQANNQ